jgi:hypothetical protein
MALPFQNDFNTGSSSGTQITLANSAGGAGNTALTPTGTSPAYSNVVVHDGSLSMLVAAAAASQVTWTLAAETHIYGRFYIHPSAIPTATARIFNCTGNVTGTNLQRIAYLLTTGQLQVSLTGLSQVNTVNALALNAWTRVEYECSVNGATATCALTTFAGDSPMPIETISTSRAFTDANLTLVAVGCGSSISPSTTYFAAFQVNNTGLPGPFVPPRPQQLVVLADQDAEWEQRQQRHRGGLVASASQRFATTTAPAAPRLVEPVLTTVTPETAPRRHMHTVIVAARSPGYAQANLPPQPPLVQARTFRPLVSRRKLRVFVQRGSVTGAVTPPRSQVIDAPPRRRWFGRVAAPWPRGLAVTVAAAATPPLPKQTLATLTPETAGRRMRPQILMPRWLAYMWAQLAPTPPPRESVVVTAPPRPRRAVRTVLARVASSTVASPVAPVRALMVTARAPQAARRRATIVMQRIIVAPTVPVRPVILLVRARLTSRRARTVAVRGGFVASAPTVTPRSPVQVDAGVSLRRVRPGRIVISMMQRFAAAAGGVIVFAWPPQSRRTGEGVDGSFDATGAANRRMGAGSDGSTSGTGDMGRTDVG